MGGDRGRVREGDEKNIGMSESERSEDGTCGLSRWKKGAVSRNASRSQKAHTDRLFPEASGSDATLLTP